jgi:hypothetical protein
VLVTPTVPVLVPPAVAVPVPPAVPVLVPIDVPMPVEPELSLDVASGTDPPPELPASGRLTPTMPPQLKANAIDTAIVARNRTLVR